MNAVSVIRLGLARGGVELRHTFTYWPDLFQNLFFPLIQIVVLFLMRGHHVPGTSFSLGSGTNTDGTTYKTRTTYGQAGQKITLDIDPTTHPAWTGGQQQLMDRGGRLTRFNKKFAGFVKPADV